MAEPRPRKPRKNASASEWENYYRLVDLWKQARDYERQSQRGTGQQQSGPRQVQYRNDDVVVKVRSGYSADHDTPTTDFIVAPRDGSDEHLHHVLDESGDTIYDEWNPNH